MTTMFAKPTFAYAAVAALSLAAAGSVFAQNADTQRNVFDSEAALSAPAAQSASRVTREQVRAEYLAARASGELNSFDYETVAYVKPAAARAPQTRVAQSAK